MARIFAVLALVCTASHAFADDGMRCGSNLVSVGMSPHEVLQRCGAPTSASRQVVPFRRRGFPGGTGGHTCIESWLYDRGATELTRTLTFIDDRLQDVAMGSYGAS